MTTALFPAEGEIRATWTLEPRPSSVMPRLLVLDLSNITHRSIHGYPPLTNADGDPVQGAFGAGATAIRMIELYQPTHVLSAGDSSRNHLARRALSADYKAHRASGDPGVTFQLAMADEVMGALGIPRMYVPEWEADDICATLARRFEGEVILVSGDKDLLALCDDRVRVHLLGKDYLVDGAMCQEIMGVRADQVTCLKALVGDSSDGYPGVPGIGAKGATALLSEHDSFEGIVAASEAGLISGRNQKALEKGLEQGRLSLELARMKEDLELAEVAPWQLDLRASVEAMEALGFPGLVRKLNAYSPAAKAA